MSGLMKLGSKGFSKITFGNKEIYKIIWNGESVYSITYPIAASLLNGTIVAPPVITKDGIASITLTANSGYALPSSASNITVFNATIRSYNSSTGILVIGNPTGAVTITASCLPIRISTTITMKLYCVKTPTILSEPDGITLQYSINNGSSWTQLARLNGSYKNTTQTATITHNGNPVKFRSLAYSSNYCWCYVGTYEGGRNLHVNNGSSSWSSATWVVSGPYNLSLYDNIYGDLRWVN